jgi:hypothetical protein
MTRSDQVLSDFMDAWNAGRRPQVREYLARVPEGAERDELAEQIGTWLEVAPAPQLSDDAREQIRSEPVVQAVFSAVGDDAGAWTVTLPRLRERAGLGVRELAGRLVERLGVGGEPEAERAAGYLDRMEHGELRPDRVSRRLLDALGDLLGISGDALADLGGGGAGAMRPAAAGGTLFRADERSGQWFAADIDVLSRAAMAEAPAPMDELDRLFCGGPDA